MKRSIIILAIFAACVGVVVEQTGRGQPGDIGPGEKGATLRLPGSEAPSAPTPSAPTPGAPLRPVASPFGASPFSPGMPASGGKKVAELPSNEVDINKDIEITEKHGSWVIYVMSYSGPDAPKLAREFVVELRNTFKLNAYVFNYGAAEKRKEYERVQKAKNDQIEMLQKAGLKGDYMPLPVRAVKIEEQSGVLIDGNYQTREEALTGLKKLRAMDMKDFAKRVQLDVKVAILEHKDKSAKSGMRVGEAELVVLNPFARSFPARNPQLKSDETPQMDSKDVELMRQLNKQEPLSVLQTRKPLTLAIKQYNTQQIIVKNKTEQDGYLDRFRKGMTLKNGEWADQAAQNAHDLAEAFRKSGLAETYVLHTKYCSFVTVGGYDSVEDSRLVQMQTFLESKFQMDAYRPYDLFRQPRPMAIPR